MSIFEDDYLIFSGLYKALLNTERDTHNIYEKVLEAQKQYFINNKNAVVDKEKALDLLDGAMHKFYMGAFALEQLWSVHEYLEVADQGLPDSYDESITYKLNKIEFLLSVLLDQALNYWRAFLDFYLKYLLLIITGQYVVTMSISDYRKVMSSYTKENPDNKIANKVDEYIRNKVFCQLFGSSESQCWGDLLKSLRDKTTHQKLIKPSIVEKKNKKGYIITWPTINGQDYSELAQCDFENNAFEMIKDFFPILYETDWIPGPYNSGMFS